MKLSNKILLGFFGFIFLYMNAAFTELRLTGIPNTINSKNSIAETVDLSGIAYVVINNVHKHVKVAGSDRTRLEVRSREGNVLKELTYNISGDTLTLSGFDVDDNRAVTISIFVANTKLKGVFVNSAAATVKEFEQGSLHVSQNSGRIWMSDNRIDNIQIELSNHSYLDISGPPLNTLSATIDGSQVTLSTPVGLLQGSMKNDAYMRVQDIGEIQVKKDNSSRLTMYQ